MKKNTTHKGPGRPKYEPIIPKSRFTMADFCEANGVDLKTGKGENCAKLTLIQFLARDRKRKGQSLIVRLKETFAEPNSKSGLGRKAMVYQLRSKFEAHKAKTAPIRKSAAPVTTEDYETQKAAILAPVAEINPTPAAEPVKEVQPTAEVAPVPEPVTAS
jgi:hypothetical protein